MYSEPAASRERLPVACVELTELPDISRRSAKDTNSAEATGAMASDDGYDLPCFSLGTQELLDSSAQPQGNVRMLTGAQEEDEEFVDDSQPDDSDFETPPSGRRPSVIRPQPQRTVSRKSTPSAATAPLQPSSQQRQTPRQHRALNHRDEENIQPPNLRGSPAPNAYPLAPHGGTGSDTPFRAAVAAKRDLNPTSGEKGKLLNKLRRASGSAEKQSDREQHQVAGYHAQHSEPLASRQFAATGGDSDGSAGHRVAARGSISPSDPSGMAASPAPSQHRKRSMLLVCDENSSDPDISPAPGAQMDNRRARGQQQPAFAPAPAQAQHEEHQLRLRQKASRLVQLAGDDSSSDSDLAPASRTPLFASRSGRRRTLPTQQETSSHRRLCSPPHGPSELDVQPQHRPPQQRRRRSQGLMAALGLQDEAGGSAVGRDDSNAMARSMLASASRLAEGSPRQTQLTSDASGSRKRRSSQLLSVMGFTDSDKTERARVYSPSPGLAASAPTKRRKSNLMSALGLSDDPPGRPNQEALDGAGGGCSSDSDDSLPGCVKHKTTPQSAPGSRANTYVLISDSDHSDSGGNGEASPPLLPRSLPRHSANLMRRHADTAEPSSRATPGHAVDAQAETRVPYFDKTSAAIHRPSQASEAVAVGLQQPSLATCKPPKTPAGNRAAVQQDLNNLPHSKRWSSGHMLTLTPTTVPSCGAQQDTHSQVMTEDIPRSNRQVLLDFPPGSSQQRRNSNLSPPHRAAVSSARATAARTYAPAFPPTEDADRIEEVSDSDNGPIQTSRILSMSGMVTPMPSSTGAPSETPSVDLGPPWWAKLEDFVPVAALKCGCDPRNRSRVHVDFLRQFNAEATPNGCKTAAGRPRSTGKSGSSSAGAGQWVTRGDQRLYVKDGEEMTGQRGYKQWSKDSGKGEGTKPTQKKKPKKKRWFKGRSRRG